MLTFKKKYGYVPKNMVTFQATQLLSYAFSKIQLGSSYAIIKRYAFNPELGLRFIRSYVYVPKKPSYTYVPRYAYVPKSVVTF